MSATWDLIITLFFVMFAAYGLLLGRGKVITALLASYVGLAVAGEAGNIFAEALKNFSGFAPFLSSLFTVKIIIFALIVIFLTLKLGSFEFGSEQGLVATGTTAVLSFLNAGLILSTVGLFMSESERSIIFAQSDLAIKIMDFRFWWLVGPFVVLVLAGMLKNRFQQ